MSAINHVVDSHNSFPNNGLTNKQILRSLDIQKLRNHKFNIDTSNAEYDNFFNIIKSYLNSDLPIILGVDVYWKKEQAQLVSEGRGHAVTVLGYKEHKNNNYLYIHDYRIGPFARVRIVNDPKQIASITKSKAESPIEWGLILEEKDDNANWQDADQVLIPDSLIVPNYRKIRIPSEYISNTCNSLIEEYFVYYEAQNKDCPKVTHEIELVSSADYKSSLIKKSKVANKEAILCKPLAKYIWCAKFKSGDLHLFDILFDSTEIPQGDAVAGISIYNQDGFDAISRPLRNILEHQLLHEDYSGKDFLVPLIRSFKEEKDNYFAYLDKQFGKPRAPIRINREEISGGQLHNQAGLSYYGKQEKCLAEDFAELLNTSDVVSRHVPETPQTQDMIGEQELSQMKKGSILINASRGTVVDIDALAKALESGQLNGAAIDVFPVEPKSNTEEFESPLRAFDNVILTPHVGGSTQEAQENIGIEVAGKLAKYSDNGSTLSAVNFPDVSLPENTGRSRLLHIHKNKPGILTQINKAFAEKGINIEAQYLQTNAEIGYVVVDVKEDRGYEALAELQQIDGTIKTRILH